MRIAIASDHGGVDLKTEIIQHLTALGHEVTDYGTNSKERVDFPDYVRPVAKEVLEQDARGILICGTGIGMCIAANKINGIRAALCATSYDATYAVRDDAVNVLCLGGRTTGVNLALDIVDHFLASEFAGGHYQARVDKIATLEQEQS